LNGLGHQVGTCRFGEDPKTSVLDLNCKANDLDNLYVVDGSFLVTSAAVNPTLTIIANALRVGEHLAGRLGGSLSARQPGQVEPDRQRSAHELVLAK
jgi:choline dehydrogenase-like flavoprotein